MSPILEVRGLSVSFPVGRRRLHALDSVSLALAHGETLGLVGESGSGKSTLARALMQGIAPEAGEIQHASNRHPTSLALSRVSCGLDGRALPFGGRRTHPR
ncbi:MAG: ATP-binding cassette domain-containing protein, partial [Elioraea tepidiphila]